jgi:elongation factor 3
MLVLFDVFPPENFPNDHTTATMSESPIAFAQRMSAAIKPKKADEATLLASYEELTSVINGDTFPQFEPEIVDKVLPTLLARYDDKVSDAKKAMKKVCNAIIDKCNKNACAVVVHTLFGGMAEETKWKVKQGSCQLLGRLAKKAKKKLAPSIPEIVQVVPGLIHSLKQQVADAAREAVELCCNVIDNRDVKPYIPALVSAMANVEEVAECIHTVASVKFVQTVDGATLGLIVPLLLRGFSVKKTATKRQCAVIINNTSKLVENPRDAAPFLPTLLPALIRASDEISDPEARSVADRARAQLERIKKESTAIGEKHPDEPSDMAKFLKEALGDSANSDEHAASIDYAAHIVSFLHGRRSYEADVWSDNVGAYLSAFADKKQAAVQGLLERMEKPPTLDDDDEEDDGTPELCNVRFTLAYGTKILLHNTPLKMKKGRKYGLVGPNDCGKTSLMRAMANGELEGFPTDLKSVFVEADILGELSHLSCIDYVFADPAIEACGVSKAEIGDMLISVGFSEKQVNDEVTTLSGGWRMKLALARAMLQKAEILLMDEPTNHLDVLNVAWVKEYINQLADVSCIMVSHDTGLLEDCCTDIILIENLKLKQYHGNLGKFVERRPEAKAFFSLRSSKLKFTFPEPSYLDGVKSKGKALMKMTDCSIIYPGNTEPTVSHVTVQVSLGSRVACIGRNGAGKSTVIKMLTGQLQPTTGTVWQHAGVKVAYVAQHAFHHIEKHLDKSANEYIRWRYQYGEDKEGLEKDTVKLTDEEIAFMKKPVPWEYEDDKGNLKREKRVIEELTGARRDPEGKKSVGFEYELKWASGARVWVHGDLLEEWGWAKQLKTIDAKVEAREGMYRRALTSDNVEQHLKDVGLDPEFGTHMRMSALSGGQKVKVVLGASTWNQPHILILDEPTNYLDRESLGGLAHAIDNFGGGVVVISHNNEFTSTLCPETWLVEDGACNCKGDAEWMKNVMKEKTDFKVMDVVTDALGNETKVKAPKKELSRKEKKQRAKIRAAKIALGEEVSDDQDY